MKTRFVLALFLAAFSFFVAMSVSTNVRGQSASTGPITVDTAPVDRNGNGIADSLEEELLVRARDEAVDIVVLLEEPVSASELATFAELGGSLRHIYYRVAYGFSGTLPGSRVQPLADELRESLSIIELVGDGIPHLDISTRQIRARDVDTADSDDAFVWSYDASNDSYSGYTGDPDSAVAVAGSGISIRHNDLGDDPDDDQPGDGDDWGDSSDPTNVVVGWFDATLDAACAPIDIDVDGHETIASGIVAGRGEVNSGLKGVAPTARLVGLKFWYDATLPDQSVERRVKSEDFAAAADWVLSRSRFGDGSALVSGLSASSLNTYVVPAFGDVDDDGKIDMIVGTALGKFGAYRNVGSASNPQWRSHAPWSDDPCPPITLPLGTGDAAPALGKLNDDDFPDLLIGRTVRVIDPATGQQLPPQGVIVALRNTGVDPLPCGSHPVQGPAPTRWVVEPTWGLNPVPFEKRPSPTLGDLVNNDGLLDLVIGRENGSLYAYENTGTAKSPVFTLRNSLVAGTYKPGLSHSRPALSDLDGDGDLDLVIGYEGGVLAAFRNDGGSSGPSWTEDRSLLYGTCNAQSGGYAAPALADLDADGYQDMIIGTRDGAYRPFAGSGDPTIHRDKFGIKVLTVSTGWCDNKAHLQQAVDSLVQNGIVVTASAGNEACSCDEAECDDRFVRYPARYPSVIAVGATNSDDQVALYSNKGDPSDPTIKPDVVAPGGGGQTNCGSGCITAPHWWEDPADPNQDPDRYASVQGTSFATPHVAGLAALIIDARQQNGSSWGYTQAEVEEVKAIILMTATETVTQREDCPCDPPRTTPLDRGFKDFEEGYGRINADAAIEAATLYWDGSTIAINSADAVSLGDGPLDKKCWARRISYCGNTGDPLEITLDVPPGASGGDYDLFLYDTTPNPDGEPALLARSASNGKGVDEFISYTNASQGYYYVAVKWVNGNGAFGIDGSASIQCGISDTGLVVNGDFSRESSDSPWIYNEGHNPGHPEPRFSVEDVSPLERALRITRATDTDGSHAVASQDIGAEIGESDQLILSFDARINRHNFDRYNSWDVYPANVWVDYVDASGNAQTFRRSFYLSVAHGHTPDAEPLAEMLTAGTWVRRSYDLSSLEPAVARVVRVRLGSQGWSYDVAFDNIALLHEAEPSTPSAFRRGDSNDDGQVDLSDAVYTLDWLFLGGPAPGCVAAANVNADEAVDLSDPVSLLSFLFLGGPRPADPFLKCGASELASDAQLGCRTPPDGCQ